MKDKKAKTIISGFIKIVNKYKSKPNKLWVYQGKAFCNNLMQKWLYNNDILMYSKHNETKSLVAERFIRNLKGKTYKNMTVIEKKSYLSYLNKFVDE